MAKGQVFRVIIDGRGLDLTNAFRRAGAADWAALTGATGRNPFVLAKRLGELERLKGTSDDQALDLLAGPVGTRLVETVGDLVFLARRLDGDREPDTDRPLTYETSIASTPVVDVFTAWTEALMRHNAAADGEADEPDPT